MAVTEKSLPNFSPDKWIKSRLDDLQSESFEHATQNRMFMEDLLESVRELQDHVVSLKAQHDQLKTKLERMPESKSNDLLGAKIEQIQKQVREMSGPKKVLRDENGFITGVRPMTTEELQQEGKSKL